MKFNKWTLGLAAVGVVSLTSAARADEKPSAVQTALSNTTISGYVSASANVGLTGGYAASPAANIPFQAGKANGFNLDVVKLSIAKPEDESPWASGYQVDLLFGPDAVGYNTSVNSSASADYAIKQAYVTLRTPVGNGIDWKIGVFDSPLGYEVFDAGSNPNYTRSYGYAVEPTELTGLQATYKVADALSLNGGVADTSAAGINNRDANEITATGDNNRSQWHEAYFGDVTLTAPSSWGWLSGSALTAGVLYGAAQNYTLAAYNVGNNSIDGYAGGNQVNYYAGLTLNTPWKELTTGVAVDYVQNYGGGYNTGVGSFHIDGGVVGLYATYKATDKLSFNARGEYVEADAQDLVGSVNLVEVTGTVEYDLWANVVSRLEVRWDQNVGSANVDGTTYYLPSVDTTERESVGLYANVIYKF